MNVELVEKSCQPSKSFMWLVEQYDLAMKDEVKTTTKETNHNVFNILKRIYDWDIFEIECDNIKSAVFEELVDRCEISYLNKIRTYLNKIFNWAVTKEIMSRNPIKNITRFKEPDKVNDEIDYYIPSEWNTWDRIALAQLRERPTDFKYYIFINVLYFMGMRPGEVRGLKIEDIEGDYITINKTCSTVNKSKNPLGYILTSPKTLNSYRTIEMPKKLKQRMKVYFAYLDGLGKNRRGLFLFGGNSPLHPETIRKKFQKISSMCGIPVYRLYALRHTHASILINGGVLDFAIARRLGHTVQELRETYAHLFKTTEGECVTLINQVHEPDKVEIDCGKEILVEFMKKSMEVLGVQDTIGEFYYAYEHSEATQIWKLEESGNVNYSLVENKRFEEAKRQLSLV